MQFILQCFKMLYHKFIQKCLNQINQRRERDFKGSMLVQRYTVPQEPTNLYLELFCEKNKKLYKLQQWNFITTAQLIESEYGQEEDPELDSFNFYRKSFFSLLDEILVNLNPKLVIKMMEPQNLKLKLTNHEEDLSPFLSQTAYLKEIAQYQTDTFRCKISLKYDYEETQEVKVTSSGEEFELLVDESYENDRIQKLKEYRKMSENIIRLANKTTKEEQQKIREQKMKKKQQINKIKEMIDKIGFEYAEGKTLHQFITSIQ